MNTPIHPLEGGGCTALDRFDHNTHSLTSTTSFLTASSNEDAVNSGKTASKASGFNCERLWFKAETVGISDDSGKNQAIHILLKKHLGRQAKR